jgi:Zn-dependent peptidase ImmA (M78 family)
LKDHLQLEVVEPNDLDGDHGRTYPDRGLILLPEDVYNGAMRGNPRDRFTVAHELGHAILHRGMASFARAASPEQQIPLFRSSEWQADAFGGELLMSADHLNGIKEPQDLVERFQVSGAAARRQYRVFEREGLLPK